VHQFRPSDIAVPVLAAGASLGLASVIEIGVGDWLFATMMLTALGFASRQTWRTWRAAQQERRRASDLQHTSATATARAAVLAERARLSTDIESYVSELINTIGRRARAARASTDPTADIAWIQSKAQDATSELRRQLGLLRVPDETSQPPADAGQTIPRLRISDVVGASVVVGLAVAERLESFIEGEPASWLSVLLTIGTAATVLGRRTVTVLAAVAAATFMMIGAVTGEPVLDGFWFAATTAPLAWTLAARGTGQCWLALGLLAAADLISRQLNEPVNMPLNAVLLTVAVVTGAIVGRHRRRLAVAATSAAERTEELRAASAEAVQGERRQIARELHDLVSHTVSLVAVQAGAAEMLWPSDRAAAREALGIIASTAEQTLAELDRLRPGRQQVQRTMTDVQELVERMRAAGLTISLAVDAEPDPALMATLYRVIQESLTNALRHAPGSQVEVTIHTRHATGESRVGDEATVVQVLSRDGAGPTTGRRGYGLIGLAERVEQIGGRLHSSPRDDPPGFAVTAVLPIPRTVAAS
jgi:signal transduction histidine kinase